MVTQIFDTGQAIISPLSGPTRQGPLRNIMYVASLGTWFWLAENETNTGFPGSSWSDVYLYWTTDFITFNSAILLNHVGAGVVQSAHGNGNNRIAYAEFDIDRVRKVLHLAYAYDTTGGSSYDLRHARCTDLVNPGVAASWTDYGGNKFQEAYPVTSGIGTGNPGCGMKVEEATGNPFIFAHWAPMGFRAQVYVNVGDAGGNNGFNLANILLLSDVADQNAFDSIEPTAVCTFETGEVYAIYSRQVFPAPAQIMCYVKKLASGADWKVFANWRGPSNGLVAGDLVIFQAYDTIFNVRTTYVVHPVGGVQLFVTFEAVSLNRLYSNWYDAGGAFFPPNTWHSVNGDSVNIVNAGMSCNICHARLSAVDFRFWYFDWATQNARFVETNSGVGTFDLSAAFIDVPIIGYRLVGCDPQSIDGITYVLRMVNWAQTEWYIGVTDYYPGWPPPPPGATSGLVISDI